MNIKIVVFDVDGTLSPFNKSCEDFRDSEEAREQLKQRNELVKLIKLLKKKNSIKFFILTRCNLKNNLILNDKYYSPIVKAVGAKNIFGSRYNRDIDPIEYVTKYSKYGRIKKIKLNRIFWAYKKTSFMELLANEFKVNRESILLIDDDGMNTLIGYKSGFSVAFSSHRHVGIDYTLSVVKNIVINNGLTNRFFRYNLVKEYNRILGDKSTQKDEYIRVKKSLETMRQKVIARPFIRNVLKVLEDELAMFSIGDTTELMKKIKLSNYESLKLT